MSKFKRGYHYRIKLAKTTKANFDWESSVLTVSRKCVNYKVYPYSADYRMKDFIFVCLVKKRELSKAYS